MGLIEQANNDIRVITTDKEGWGVDIQLIAPDTTVLDTVGLHTKHHLSYDTEGNMVNYKNAHISISEDEFIDNAYPYRDASNEVNMEGHRCIVKDSTRQNVEYVIREWYPDETIGLIVMILGDYAS